MPTWVIPLILELLKLLAPIIKNVMADEKPNPEAAKEEVARIKKVVHRERPDRRRL